MAQRSWSGSNQWYSQQQQQQQMQMQSPPPPPPPPSPSSQPHQQIPSQQFGPVPQWQSMNGVNMPSGMMTPPPSYSMSYGPQLTPPQSSWGPPPPLYQQAYMQPGFCDTTACCGPPGQADPCDCCSPAVGGVGCCCGNNGPIDPFCCGPPTTPGCSSCLTSHCDWTYCVMLFFTLLSVVGFIVVMVFNKNDDLFHWFEANNTVALQTLLKDEIVIVENVCTARHLLTIGSIVCMEGNLNANTFVVQLSAWNTARDTLYFIAMVFSIITFVYANLVDYQRKNVRMQSMESQFQQQQLQQQQHQQQDQQQDQHQEEERPKGHNDRKKQQQQQQQQEKQQKQGKEPPTKSKRKEDGRSTSQQPNRQPLVPPMIRGPIEVYGVPFYEFMRIAWFVMGVAVFLWVCNMMVSFWAFSSFYRKSTTGKLHDFFEEYNVRFSASVICVTIYLAWPLVNIFVELALWVVFFIPWVIIRSICKPGIGRLRPALPLDEMPGWVRLDMFFMDFNDIRRIGFSEPAWTILTGSTAPLMSCCIDPTIDRDPTMSTWQQQQQQQWYARMQSMYPMGMVLPHTPPATVPAAAQGQTHSVDMRAVSTTNANNNNNNTGGDDGASGGESSPKSRRHHEGRSSSRHKRRSSRSRRERDEDDVIGNDADMHSFSTSATLSVTPSTAAVVATSPNANNNTNNTNNTNNNNNNNGGGDDGTPRRRHRSSSASRHRSRHHDGTRRSSRHAERDDGGETNGEGGESRSRHRRHSSSRHRRHSSSRHRRHESNANVNNTTNSTNNHTNDRPDRVNNADLDRMLDEL